VAVRLLPIADTAQVRRYGIAVLRRHPRLLGNVFALYSVGAVAGLVGPRLLGGLVQSVQQGTTTSHVDAVAAELLAFVVVQSILIRFAAVEAGKLGEAVLAELREEFVGHVLELPLSTVEQAGSGDLVTRASRDVDALRRLAQLAVPTILIACSTILLTVGAMALASPVLALVLLVAVPPIWISTRWYLNRATAGYLRENAAYAQITEALSATVTGAATVEAFRLGPRRVVAGDTAITESYNAERYTLGLRSRYFPVIEFTYYLPTVAALLLGGYMYIRGWTSLSAVTAVALYAQQIANPIAQLLEWLDTLQVGGASLARLLGVSQVPPDRTAGAHTVAEPRELVGADVRFAYVTDRDVLHGIDITVRPGERFAMVGPSGAGKSTLGRLLAGIHGPREGTVRLGGAPLIELPLGDLRGEVVLVSQDHHVFAGTLRENLMLAAPRETQDDALWSALGTVDARDWAEALPEGLGTRVGSGGQDLNAAQAQQLALARLLLADPKVLVLDEATSLLDPRSARHLERSLSAVLAGRTVIAIAHRLHTAHDADRVAVVEDGRIAELGPHDELIAADGAYAQLWASWHGQTVSVSAPVHTPAVESEAL
jgi:ABC-type multidrug transport system fused ATPase/permease subunit